MTTASHPAKDDLAKHDADAKAKAARDDADAKTKAAAGHDLAATPAGMFPLAEIHFAPRFSFLR